MQELRKKTEGATEPEADRREYVVNVELLNTKEDEAPPSGSEESAKADAEADGHARSRPSPAPS